MNDTDKGDFVADALTIKALYDAGYLTPEQAKEIFASGVHPGTKGWATPATATPLEDFKAIPRLGDLLGRKGLFGVDGIPALSGSGLPGAPIPAEPSPGSPDSCSQEPRHELLGAPGSPEPAPEPESPATGQIPDLAEASPEPPESLELHVEPCPRCGASCDVEPTTAQVWCHEWCGYSYLVANIRPVDVRPLDARQPATFEAVLAAHNRDCRDLRAMRMLRAMYDEEYSPALTSFWDAGWSAAKLQGDVQIYAVDDGDPAEAILKLEEKPDAQD